VKAPPDPTSGTVLLCIEASLPSLGNTLATSADGDGTIRLSVSPADVPEVARVLALLSSQTFYLSLIAKAPAKRKSALATE
jgi:hypothetical protein